MKGNMGQIKEEETYSQAMSNPKKEQDSENEDPMTHPCHKS